MEIKPTTLAERTAERQAKAAESSTPPARTREHGEKLLAALDKPRRPPDDEPPTLTLTRR